MDEAPAVATPPQNDVAAAPAPVPVEVGDPVEKTPNFSRQTDDVLALYESVSGLRTGVPITVYVQRLTGTPAQAVIDTQPPLGSGLYKELQRIHGRHQEAEYEVSFRSGREPRGVGIITMPGPNEEGQVMPLPWPQQPAPQPQQQPVASQPQQPSQGMNWEAFQALQKQQFDLLLAAQRSGGGAVAAPQLPPSAPPPLPQPPPPAAPPPSTSPMDMWSMFQAMQRQQLELLQEMQKAAGAQQLQPPQVQPQQQPPPPVQQSSPPQSQIQTPPGMVRTDIGFVSAEQLLRVIAGDARPSASPGGYRVPPGPRSSYYDRSNEPQPPADPQYGAAPPPMYGSSYRPSYGQQQPQPVQRERTPMEVMREALGLSKAIVDMADQIRPPAVPVAPPEPEPPGDDSPVRVIDVGPAKMILNNDDGSTRVWESLIVNAPSAFKFMGEQLDAIRKMNMEREARKQQPQQLPPGYVEVVPGYVPPEGYTAVPVGVGFVPPQAHRPAPTVQPVVMQPQPVQAAPVQAAPVVLPDPPAQMPAPIAEEPRAWEPTFGGGQ